MPDGSTTKEAPTAKAEGHHEGYGLSKAGCRNRDHRRQDIHENKEAAIPLTGISDLDDIFESVPIPPFCISDLQGISALDRTPQFLLEPKTGVGQDRPHRWRRRLFFVKRIGQGVYLEKRPRRTETLAVDRAGASFRLKDPSSVLVGTRPCVRVERGSGKWTSPRPRFTTPFTILLTTGASVASPIRPYGELPRTWRDA